MEAPGAGPSLDELLAERYERLSDFINVDRLNLFAAVSLLNARYLATGPTDQEVPNDSVPVLEWASTVGMQRAAEVLLVGLWSALESFVEDVFVLVCMHRSFGSGQLPNARARLGEFMTLTEEERWRVVWERAETAGKTESGGKFAVDRCDDVFKPLEISVDIQPDPGVVGPFRVDNELARRLLRELQAIRNALLHGEGRADRRLNRLNPAEYPVDEPIALTPEKLIVFGVAVHSYAATLAEAAGDDLTIEID